jgi:hypothetical protein
MSVVVSPHTQEHLQGPRLKLLSSPEEMPLEPVDGQATAPPPLHLVDDPPCILVAGADATQRAALLQELAKTLSAGTLFAEAGAISEVLEHAPTSRIVMLTGDLKDASVESLMRLLVHRHPRLPVVTLGGPPRVSVSRDVPAARA